MKRTVFADTSFYAALLIPSDEHHAAAVALAAEPGLVAVTTEHVLVELGNFVAESGRRASYLPFLQSLMNSRATRVVPSTRGRFMRAAGLYARRSDKGWSMTDCFSFAVMAEYRIREALTADHHFVQAGYRALMR